MDLRLFDELNISKQLSQENLDSLAHYSEKINNGDTSYATLFARGRHLAPAYLYKKEFVDQIAARLTQANFEINSLVFQDMRRIEFDCSRELRKFSKPTLIIQGENDIVPLDFAQRAHETIPNSELKLIPECAHYPWLEQPGIYFEEIDTFINKNT